MALNSRVSGETFWECGLSSVPSPSRAYLDWDRRAEGYLNGHTLCPEYLYRVCPVPGSKAVSQDPIPHHGGSPVTDGTHQQGSTNETRLDVRKVPGQISEMARQRTKGEGPNVEPRETHEELIAAQGRRREKRRGAGSP